MIARPLTVAAGASDALDERFAGFDGRAVGGNLPSARWWMTAVSSSPLSSPMVITNGSDAGLRVRTHANARRAP